jgi:LuxR family transcriptional regulator, quorum-sensing system regulator CciR
MSDMQLVHDFVALSSAVRTFGALHAAVDSATRELGFRHFALVEHCDSSRSGRPAIFLHTYPEAWVANAIKAQRYSSDPIHVASYRTSTGFVWGDVANLITLSSEHKKVLREATSNGIGEGYTVPAHLPGEANGTCSFAQPSGKPLCRSSLPAAQLIGTYAFEAARRIAKCNTKGSPKADVRLTNRHLDCIVLVAKGKSDWEIAKILGIKEDTVSEHLNEARRRYDVERRIQLVTHALYDGYLTLSDALH